MIQPNDLLLLVGEPSVLKSVYRAIKRELGQFPEPFGTNIYIYIDMNIINFATLESFLQSATYVHDRLKHKLIIKIVHPNSFNAIWKIKEYANDNIWIDIEYNDTNLEERFFEDVKNYHVGLLIVSKEMFEHYHSRNMFYEAYVPVLKIADKSFADLKDASMILADNRDLEKISSTIFDISEQMDYKIEIYNYMSEHQEAKEQVIEHYNNLSTIFSKTVKIIQESQNPITVLKQKENFIQMLPFTKKITQRKIYSLLSTDSEKLYHKLDEYHQFFIPVQI
jgi:hypothetical protein